MRTKPKPNWDGVYTSDPSFHLSAAQRAELVEIAELDQAPADADAMIDRVERFLSSYPSMREAIDNAPRAAHKIAFLKPLRMEADRLLRGLRTYNDQHVSWDLTVHGFSFDVDHDALADLLSKFIEASGGVLTELERAPSRHGPTQGARRFLVLKLCHVFDRFSRCDDGNGYQQLRANFVAVCLDAAEIERPKLVSNEGKFRRLSQVGTTRRNAARLLRELPEVCRECRAAHHDAQVAADERSSAGHRAASAGISVERVDSIKKKPS